MYGDITHLAARIVLPPVASKDIASRVEVSFFSLFSPSAVSCEYFASASTHGLLGQLCCTFTRILKRTLATANPTCALNAFLVFVSSVFSIPVTVFVVCRQPPMVTVRAKRSPKVALRYLRSLISTVVSVHRQISSAALAYIFTPFHYLDCFSQFRCRLHVLWPQVNGDSWELYQ